MERNPYLMNRYIKYFLTAAILTMAAYNINAVVDGMLMGNFLGPDALAAINIALPATMGIAATTVLMSSGASVLCARAIGELNYDRAQHVFSVCISSMLALGILLVAVAFAGSDYIADCLCVEKSLYPLVREYLFVNVATGICTVINSGLGQLLNAAGQPRMVTRAMLVSMAVNIICDVLYVYVLGGSIGFAALATATGFIASIIYICTYFRRSDCPYKFVFSGLKFISQLKENMANGLPNMTTQLAQMLLSLVINYFIQANAGSAGMFVVSVGITMTTISFTMVNGVSMSFLSIGSMMIGEKDWQGVRMMFSSSLKIVLGSVAFFIVVGILFASDIAVFFGATSIELRELAAYGIPMIMLFVPGFGIAAMMGITYQVLGYRKLSSLANFSFLAGLTVSFAFCSLALPPQRIWYAFPVASVLIAAAVLIMSEASRRKGQGRKSFLTLLPIIEADSKIMDISVALSEDGMRNGLAEVGSFCQKMRIAEVGNKINLCLEELMVNILQHAGRGKNHYMDVKVVISDEGVTASLRDDGKPFDPVHYAEENRHIGLKLLHANCNDINYRYSFGQNMTILKWYK